MTIHDGYVLAELFGQTYLLPYGQNIAAFRRGMKLNASGRLIWEALREGKTENELLSLLAAHYHTPEDEYPMLQKDIAQFVEQLRAHGIIDRPAPCFCFSPDSSRKFCIGTVVLQLNLPDALIPEEFYPFSADSETKAADLTVSVRFGQPPARPTGKLLVRSAELMIIEAEDCYSLVFSGAEHLIECHVDKSAHFACFYCREFPGSDCRRSSCCHSLSGSDCRRSSGSRDLSGCRGELFHGIRFVYLMRAQAQGLYAIHSASVLYRDQAWLFSAVSGTGKSTHAALWKNIYGAKLLNGDLNLLGIKDGAPLVYGLPWCGTSGISTAQTTPLGGIIFLRQAPRDTAQKLSMDTIQLMLSQRLISPAWTADMLQDSLDFCGRLTPLITSFLLGCTMNPEAARVCKAAIDEASGQHRGR